MTRTAARHAAAALGAPALTLALLAGCDGEAPAGAPAPSSSPATAGASPQTSSAVPPEFAPACGAPGRRVVTDLELVLVRHADCDLTGVTIVSQGRGALVPPPGGLGLADSAGVRIWVDPDTLDVTITAEDRITMR
ncbi:MAG: hypothetical protein JWN08_2269 [Frankiales bacterium]|jgi:hypothetical protein|nr:hypothetical protein [Frankiales bacterium]